MVAIRSVIVALALLLVTTPVWAQAAPAAALQGFSVVLVLGDVQDGATADNIPAAARAALGDLRDFLPYRSYRVLDTAWVLASSPTRQAVTSRLRGLEEQEFEIILERMPVAASSLQVHFVMQEPRAYTAHTTAAREDALRSELQQLIAARAALENQLKRTDPNTGEILSLRQRLSDNEIAIETQKNQLGASFGGATLIDTSFNMALGETVVVGTSRMRGGNRALIVLLTAATRTNKRE
jgi:hypothetical protein